jgi:glycosyltransferase involved in cell wall biosynthesis
VARELERAGVPATKVDVVYDGVQLPFSSAFHPKTDFLAVALASGDPGKGRELVEQACALASVPVLFSEDLSVDLLRASLFVYISRSEGLGSAALLAMSLGLPVVASRVGGLPEIVTDMESGLLVENDPQTIANAITKLKSDSELAHSLGRNGRTRVEREFTEKHMVENTLQSYARALAS